jgi:D-alanine-D-alanine ligase
MSGVDINVEALGKVAVLMGGHSAEREISLQSGAAVVEALKSRQVNVHGIDVGVGISDVLRDGHFDRAFIALHGRGGEDGVIHGMLELLQIPYTGSGVLASALSMDKLRCKQLWAGIGLPTPPFALLNADSDFPTVAAEVGLPLMVKPGHEGSSVGMSKVDDAAQLEAAWREAAKYDDLVLAERWIAGGEFTVAILGGEALPVIRLETPREFYDYEAKYQAESTQYHCPSGLDAATEQRFQQLALAAFDAVGARSWGRVDLMADADGNPWLLEINTVPGLTDHSLVPMAARAAGIGFEDLILRILADARLDSEREAAHGR